MNDQNKAAVDERLATECVKDWINRRVLPQQIDNPIRQFKNVKSITCLVFASLIHDARTVQQLIDAGADAAVTDSKGFSPLRYACASDIDSDAKVAHLMQRDASSQTAAGSLKKIVPNQNIYTISLRLAAAHNQAGRVKTLIYDHGASVNATDRMGRTALHLAAAAGHAEAVKVLLQHPDCDISMRDRYRLSRSAESVNALVMFHGNDFSTSYGRGLTAADWARGEGHDDIATLIDHINEGNFT